MPHINLHDLVETHERPFVVIDAQYRIVAANQAYCCRYGQEREALLQRHCYEVSHHADRPCHEHGEECPHQVVYASGAACEMLHTHYDRTGHACRTRIRGMPLRGAQGRLYLGEILFPLEAESSLSCSEMRMVGRSPAFLACIDRLARAAESEASILLIGESGVGKELAARFLHERSSRAGKPFIAINCAAVPESMFENELFGHERGAFTGSIGQKKGLFELADGGTLFLDEIAEIPPARQAKLLRVLETGEFRRVGGTATLRADVRLVSATNRQLLDWVDQGRFREDLYYRVAGIDITLPTLRERREDIPALAEALLAQMAAGADVQLDKAAAARLQDYAFPGNVRELRNVMQRALVLSRGGVIRAEDLQFQQVATVPPPLNAGASARSEPSGNLKTAEREHIRALLAQHAGHRRSVADALGISERTLYRKLARHGLG